MIIRRATAADIEAIANVHVQAWHEAYPDLLPLSEIEARPVEVRIGQWQNTLTNRDRPTFVAEQDGVVRGFVSGGGILWSGLATDGEVSAIYLLEAIKRRNEFERAAGDIRMCGLEFDARAFAQHLSRLLDHGTVSAHLARFNRRAGLRA